MMLKQELKYNISFAYSETFGVFGLSTTEDCGTIFFPRPFFNLQDCIPLDHIIQETIRKYARVCRGWVIISLELYWSTFLLVSGFSGQHGVVAIVKVLRSGQFLFIGW
jgi:hypothetical protein